MSPKPPAKPLTRSQVLEAAVRKALRKRDAKSLHTLGAEIGVSMKTLTLPVSKLVKSGEAIKHPATSKTPPTYTKA